MKLHTCCYGSLVLKGAHLQKSRTLFTRSSVYMVQVANIFFSQTFQKHIAQSRIFICRFLKFMLDFREIKRDGYSVCVHVCVPGFLGNLSILSSLQLSFVVMRQLSFKVYSEESGAWKTHQFPSLFSSAQSLRKHWTKSITEAHSK